MSGSRVYFGRLPRDCTERELERLARDFGRVKDIRLLSGFGFVEFDDKRDARDCIEKLDGSKLMGERIQVEQARGERGGGRRGDRDGSPPRRSFRGNFRLIVEHLPSRTSWQDLKDLMRRAGEVVFADVDRNGDGIVEFSTARDMEEAIKLFDDTDYHGKRIYVKEAPRSGSPSGDRKDRDRSDRGDKDRDRNGDRDRDRGDRDRGDRDRGDRGDRDRARSKERNRSASPPSRRRSP
ncbi:hypothetical protein BJ742DRAFT_806441 [Cladochytrium replicatum]|nr:hypothetical protein BJ742DRAFT_806441 [Cladochytrium replicatum]